MRATCRWAVSVILSIMAWEGLLASGGERNQQSLDRQFQTAVSNYNSGQYSQAAKQLEILVVELPKNFDLQELMGLVYSAQAKDQEAHSHFEKAVELRPNSGPARANLAVNLSKLGKNSQAEAEFKKALALEPHSYETNHDFGEFYVRAGNLVAAIPYLEEAHRLNLSSYENGYDLALAYEQTNQLKPSQRLIQQMLEKKDTAELHNLLAGVDEKAGEFVMAANEYERAAHMDPSEANLFDWGGELLVHQTPNPAIEVFSEGLKRFPNSSRLAVGLGLALYLRGSYDDAVKSFLRATDLNPSDPREYYFLSKAYDRSPSLADEVMQRFRHFAELRPNDAQAAFYYAISLWKGKRSETSGAYLDQVESLLKRAVMLDPSSPEPHLQLGNFYSQRGKHAEAVPEYLEALKLSPDVPDAHFRLGQAYTHLGKKDLAQQEFQLHQQIYEQHLAEVDQQRSEIQQFVYSMKGAQGGP